MKRLKTASFKCTVTYQVPIDPPTNETQAMQAIKESFERIRPPIGAYIVIEGVDVEPIEEFI